MDRTQFMEQLEKMLSDISKAEREEALDYYENYFDDAGPENEASVIRELGSPGKVAAIIKADLKESNDAYAEYTEQGYQDQRDREQEQTPACHGEKTGEEAQEERRNRASWRAKRGYHAEERRGNAPAILTIIILVFLSPFLAGALGGVLGVIVCIALLPFILTFGAMAVVVAMAVGGVACLVAGIGSCISYPAMGMVTIGVGLLMLAVGILALLALIWLAGTLLPALLRKFTDFCNRILRRERKDGAKI